MNAARILLIAFIAVAATMVASQARPALGSGAAHVVASEASSVVAGGGPDTDGDGVPDASDNCPDTPNVDQSNIDGDGEGDVCDLNIDGDALPNLTDPCPTLPEDYDGFEDGDGCTDTDNDVDGVCDAGLVSVSCAGSDSGAMCFDPAVTLACTTRDCRNVAEDYDNFKDSDGCPEPDNDNDGFQDFADNCPGSAAAAGTDGMLGSPQDLNHNGVRDIATEALFTTDDVVKTFEDYDTVLDGDGCHDSPGEDFDADGYSDDNEALKIGTDPGYPCGASAWPSDLVSADLSLNKLDIQDLVSFIVPVRLLDKSPGPASPYNARWDLSPGPTFPFTNHINIVDVTTLLNGAGNSPAFPPMLGGLRAFDKMCPLAPQ